MAKACSLPGRLFAFEDRVQKLSIQPIHRMIRYHSKFDFLLPFQTIKWQTWLSISYQNYIADKNWAQFKKNEVENERVAFFDNEYETDS